MAQKTREELKALWIAGYKPLKTDYDDVWDSFKTISTGNTFTAALTFDYGEKLYNEYTQTGGLSISVDSNTYGAGAYQFIPIISNGDYILFPSDWIIGDYEYTGDSDNYYIEIYYDGYDYYVSLKRKASTVEILITASKIAIDNTFIEFDSNFPLYNDLGLSGALQLSDFTVTFSQNGGTATAWTASSITNQTGGALAGGETRFRIYGSVTGTADGNETIEITPADNTSVVADVGGVPLYMLSAQTTGLLNLVYVSQTMILNYDLSRFETVTTSNADVSLLEDLSASGNDASQGTAAKQPTHTQFFKSIAFTFSAKEFLAIGDIAAYEFQDNQNFSMFVWAASINLLNQNTYLFGNRGLLGVNNAGWYCGYFNTGRIYFGIHDGTTSKSINNGVSINDGIFRKFIITHNSSGESYMYDEDNTLIASDTSALLSAIDYTGLTSNIGSRHVSETDATSFGTAKLRCFRLFSGVLSSDDRLALFALK